MAEGPPSMRRGNRCPWVVIRLASGELWCERCERGYTPAMPAPMEVYIAICNAFTRGHRACKPPVGEALELERHRVGQ